MKRVVIFFLPLLLFYTCTTNVKQKKLVSITESVDKLSGFVDLSLNIVERTETDSTYNYIAEGLYQKDTVGVEVSLKKGIRAQTDNMGSESQPPFIQNGIILQSIGKKSDKLLTSMAQLYGINYPSFSFRKDAVHFFCVNSNNQDVNYGTGAYIFRVVMENQYICSEMYVNFDFDNQKIHLNEKNVEFRRNIITYLSGKSSSNLARTSPPVAKGF